MWKEIEKSHIEHLLQSLRLYSHLYITTVHKAACDTSNTVNILNFGGTIFKYTDAGMKQRINTLQMMSTIWKTKRMQCCLGC